MTGVHRGFTLVEVLIALVIGGILLTTVLRFVQGQIRFTEAQHAREEVQQNLRSSLDLIATEVRGVSASAGGILDADATSMTVHIPQAFGVVCRVSSGPDLVSILFPPEPGMRLTFGNATPLLLLSPGGGDATTVPASAMLLTSDSRAAARSACDAELNPVPASLNAYQFTVGSTSGLARAAAVALTERVTYRPQQPTSPAGSPVWLYRSVGMKASDPTQPNMQPLAGPLQENGLRFRFYSDASSDPLPVPLSAADRRAVTSIEIVVAVESRDRNAVRRQRVADSVRVGLRN